MNIKQVIVIRKDLEIPPGKLAVQVAHASVGALLQQTRKTIRFELDVLEDVASFNEKETSWIDGIQRKICLEIESEEALLDLYKKIKPHIDCYLVKDLGLTIFKEPTITCLGIGPDYDRDIDAYTAHLKLYK